MFNCCLEHNETTACSIIKMFDILEAGGISTGSDNTVDGALPERVSKFLKDHLFSSFNYLPTSDLK